VIRIIPITHCRNRRFFRIVATRLNYTTKEEGYIEDLGSIDPMPNRDNKIMVALNVERIKYYLGRQLPIKGIIGEILGKELIFISRVVKIYSFVLRIYSKKV
jgi:ribosomal protein S16